MSPQNICKSILEASDRIDSKTVISHEFRQHYFIRTCALHFNTWYYVTLNAWLKHVTTKVSTFRFKASYMLFKSSGVCVSEKPGVIIFAHFPTQTPIHVCVCVRARSLSLCIPLRTLRTLIDLQQLTLFLMMYPECCHAFSLECKTIKLGLRLVFRWTRLFSLSGRASEARSPRADVTLHVTRITSQQAMANEAKTIC